MSDGFPTSRDVLNAVQEALGRKLPLRVRIKAWLSHLRSRAATMGGYWGGITMRDPKNPNK